MRFFFNPHNSLLLLLLSVGCAQADAIKIAVASNFHHSLKTILKNSDFQPSKYKLSSASSGVLYAQIVHGAPFDLFLSADTERPEMLEQQNLTITDSRRTYVKGQLAFWQPDTSPKQNSLQTATNIKRISLANPKFAPYGKAAEVYLKRNPINAQRVLASNVIQAFQFIDSGNVDAGFVALSTLKLAASQSDDKKYLNYLIIPPEQYPAIEQQLVILKQSQNQLLAKRLVDFLLTENTQAKLAELGFLPVNRREQKAS